jgi:gamma-glutamyltranspeptidase/glutathione hydrolase
MRITGSSPCLLFRDGEPFLVLGAPGGTFIIGAVLQTILNVVDFGMTALEAVSAPRIDCQGDSVYLEGRIPQGVCDELAGMGLNVRRDSASYGAYPTSAARVHAIVLDGPAGGIRGGADPRGYGVALGL